jgi:hypothetical protein
MAMTMTDLATATLIKLLRDVRKTYIMFPNQMLYKYMSIITVKLFLTILL